MQHNIKKSSLKVQINTESHPYFCYNYPKASHRKGGKDFPM